MTAAPLHVTRTRKHSGLLDAVRWAGALTAAMALAALIAVSGPLGQARAASSGGSYNQMTGVGDTASSITVPWTSGLRNSDNQPISGDSASDGTDGTAELSPNSDREAYAEGKSTTSPLSFMYGDFKNLSVTVSQTQNITHQGITIRWSGGVESTFSNSAEKNFLQIMECYGDNPDGPSPEDCEYGSANMLGSNPDDTVIGTRLGLECAPTPGADPPSTENPPAGQYAFGDESQGCDPYEPATVTPNHCFPSPPSATLSCADGIFTIPFVPANDPTSPIYGDTQLAQSFDQFNTNEVQEAFTNSANGGQLQFETLTANQSPGLGCGQLESDGQPRDCWLVIVPRGTYEPNGYKLGTIGPGWADVNTLNSSPLSASNWAQRIQIHLDYAPLTTNCPPTVLPDAMVGTQVVYRAVASWENALNLAAKCNRVYSYTATEEAATTTQIQQVNSGGAGLAFTTIPIGSEATRYGGKAPKLPPLLYAPVAVTALDFGFNIDAGSGYVTKPVNLTPQLAAQGLTQVYEEDLPDYDPEQGLVGPSWLKGNPYNITFDPAFRKLNSEVTEYQPSNSIAPFLVGDLSADNQRVWQWIQSDPTTASWLDGGDTSAPVHADPDYVKLDLGKSPAADQFPQAYTGVLKCEQAASASICGKDAATVLDSEDLIPVETNFDQAASTVLSGVDSGNSRSFNQFNIAPNGTSGWWNTVGAEPPVSTFAWTMADMPDLAAYGVISAALCNSSGADCVQPSVTNVTAALNSATKDSAGLLQVNPAKVPAGAYPLVDVVYAAVPTNQPAAALNAYADLIAYAAGQGQTTGTAPGDLPPGYLPLNASLQAQAAAVVKKLRAIAGPTPTQSPTHSAAPTHSATQSPTSTRSGTATPTTSTSTTPTSGASPTPTVGASATPTQGACPTTSSYPSASPRPTQSGVHATATSTPTQDACPTTSSSPSAQGPATIQPSASLAGGTTPANESGGIRLALVVVLIIGAAGALGGSVLRFGRLPQASRFRRRHDEIESP